MSERPIKPVSSSNSKIARTQPPPRSLEIAQKGIRTDREFSALMSALMSDLIEGSITPGVGNATVNAGGKLLKVVEMRLRFGTQHGEDKVLQLTA